MGNGKHSILFHIVVGLFHLRGKDLILSFFRMKLLFVLLFSAHISYGKGKYLNQTGFFFFFTKFAKILFLFKFKGVTHRIQPT